MKVANNSPPHTRGAQVIPSSLRQSLAANMKTRMASIVRNILTPLRDLTSSNSGKTASSTVTSPTTETEKINVNLTVKNEPNNTEQSKPPVVTKTSPIKVVAKTVSNKVTSSSSSEKVVSTPSKISTRSCVRAKVNVTRSKSVKNYVNASPNGPKGLGSRHKSLTKVVVNPPKNTVSKTTVKNKASFSSSSKVTKKSPSKLKMEFSPMNKEDNLMILSIKPIENLTEALKPEKPSPVELLIERNKYLRDLSQAGVSVEPTQLPFVAPNIKKELIECNNIPPSECPDEDCNLCDMPEQPSQILSKKLSPQKEKQPEQLSKNSLPQNKEKPIIKVKSEPISPSKNVAPKNVTPVKNVSPAKYISPVKNLSLRGSISPLKNVPPPRHTSTPKKISPPNNKASKTETKKSLIEELKSVRLDKAKSASLRCQICKMTLSNAGNLRRHNLLHTGEKRFKCKNCNARFYQSHHLIQHNATHLIIKKFSCDICLLKFKTLRYLVRHQQIHNNSTFGNKKNKNPNYKCSYCKKVFQYKGSLRRHIPSHEKPLVSSKPTPTLFKCGLCEKEYRHIGYLQRHSRVHTHLDKIKCDVCLATFTNLTLLHKHKHRKHMNTFEPKNRRLTK